MHIYDGNSLRRHHSKNRKQQTLFVFNSAFPRFTRTSVSVCAFMAQTAMWLPQIDFHFAWVPESPRGKEQLH